MTDPIDLADLRLRAQRAREFHFSVDDARFALRHPSRFEAERIWSRCRDDMVGAMHDLVVASLIGWEGVLVRDALAEAKNGAEPLPFSTEAAELLLEERTDWLNGLGTAVVARMKARHDAIEADRKNLQTECDTSAAAATASNSAQSVSAH